MPETTYKGTKLNACPVCGARADVQERRIPNREVYIVCSKTGCRDVLADKLSDAAKLWNEPLKWIK